MKKILRYYQEGDLIVNLDKYRMMNEENYKKKETLFFHQFLIQI